MNIFYKKSYIVFTLTILLSFLYVPVLFADIIYSSEPPPPANFIQVIDPLTQSPVVTSPTYSGSTDFDNNYVTGSNTVTPAGPNVVSSYPSTSGGLAEGNLVSLVKGLVGVVNSVIILVVGLAVMVFIWGIVRYLYSAGDASARAEWRNYMIYGVIALTVITGIWGIVNGVASLLGIGFVGPVFPKLEPETVSMLSTVYLS